MIEYATGLKPDDPKMGDRLVEDAKFIIAKYGLPLSAGPLSEIEQNLRKMAQKNKVDIRNKSDCGRFFDEYPYAAGVSFGESVGVDIDKNDSNEYWKGLLGLRHELIHSMQAKKYPGMPTEVREYEAYIAGDLNAEYFKKHPENIEEILGWYMNASVSHWYRAINKKKRQNSIKITPEWDNPEFFLRNVDKVSDEEIERYKQTDDYKEWKEINEGQKRIDELRSQEDYDLEEVIKIRKRIGKLETRRANRNKKRRESMMK